MIFKQILPPWSVSIKVFNLTSKIPLLLLFSSALHWTNFPSRECWGNTNAKHSKASKWHFENSALVQDLKYLPGCLQWKEQGLPLTFFNTSNSRISNMPKKVSHMLSLSRAFLLVGLKSPGPHSWNMHFFQLNAAVSLWRDRLNKQTNKQTKKNHTHEECVPAARDVLFIQTAKLAWKHVKQLVWEVAVD